MKNAQLVQVEGRKSIALPEQKSEEFVPDNERSPADKFFDQREKSHVNFYFKDIKLDYVDYELNLSFNFIGNCGALEEDSVKIPFKRDYIDTTDSILYQ